MSDDLLDVIAAGLAPTLNRIADQALDIGLSPPKITPCRECRKVEGHRDDCSLVPRCCWCERVQPWSDPRACIDGAVACSVSCRRRYEHWGGLT